MDKPVAKAVAALATVRADDTYDRMWPDDQRAIDQAIAVLRRYEDRERRETGRG